MPMSGLGTMVRWWRIKGHGPNVRAWGSGYVTSWKGQALGFVEIRSVYPSIKVFRENESTC